MDELERAPEDAAGVVISLVASASPSL